MKRKQVACTNENAVSGVSEMSSIIWHRYFFLLTNFLPLAYKGTDRMNHSPRKNMGGLLHLEMDGFLKFFQGLKVIHRILAYNLHA